MVALVAEGGAVAARAAALLGHVQVPLAVEGDPVLGPWLLVAPLAGYFLKGITLVPFGPIKKTQKLEATCLLNYTYL